MRSVTRAVAVAALSFCQFSAGAADGTAEPRLEVATAARAIQPGEVVRIDVSCTCSMPLEQVKAVAFGQEIAFARSGQSWRGLVGIDLAVQPGPYTVTIEAAGPALPALTATPTLRVIPKRFPTRQLRVAPEFVEPSPAALQRIAREGERIDQAIQAVSGRLWDGIVLQPVDGLATSNFGSRSVFNGQRRAPHGGIDFRAETGTPVKAPSAGRVVLADDLFFTGNTIIIDHGQGLYSLLAHLSQSGVEVGAEVMPGEIVGLVGATGRVTGPHLHWSVRLNGARVDPLSLLSLVTGARDGER
jgi:murein DD-endopeptidase MepM/ murein hydrolase activator NlpD